MQNYKKLNILDDFAMDRKKAILQFFTILFKKKIEQNSSLINFNYLETETKNLVHFSNA